MQNTIKFPNLPMLKKMCIEMKTMDTPIIKFRVKVWPKSRALIIPVNIVAMVDEYFFRIVSANLKKKEDKIPCIALLTTSRTVTPLNPTNIELGVIAPLAITAKSPSKLKHAP